MGCLYRLTFQSGKAYIGISATDAKKRFYKHAHLARVGSKLAVHAAIRKYGEQATGVETLVVADWGYLRQLEKLAIVAFGTRAPHGYNLTDGGEGVVGHRHSPETRERFRRRVYTEEVRAAMSHGAIGKKQKCNTSGHPGVFWDKSIGKWRPRITIRGAVKYLGVFVDWFDAVAARKSAEHRLVTQWRAP